MLCINEFIATIYRVATYFENLLSINKIEKDGVAKLQVCTLIVLGFIQIGT